MNSNKKNVFLFFVIVVLSYLASPYLGRLFEIIIGHRVSGGWIGGCPECFEGFWIAFPFFAAMLLLGFLDQKRLKIAVSIAMIFPILALLDKAGELFLLSLGAGVIGLGLGQVVYLIRKKLGK